MLTKISNVTLCGIGQKRFNTCTYWEVTGYYHDEPLLWTVQEKVQAVTGKLLKIQFQKRGQGEMHISKENVLITEDRLKKAKDLGWWNDTVFKSKHWLLF